MPKTTLLLFLLLLSVPPFAPEAGAQTFEPAQYTHQHVAGVWQSGYLNGPSTGSMLGFGAMTMDAGGNIYLAGGNRVRVLTSSGRVWNLAGTGVRGYKDGPAQNAMFNTGGGGYDFQGIAKNSSGALFIPDGINARIRMIYKTTAGQWWVATYAGNGSTYLSPGQTGSINNVKFLGHYGVAVDSSDNVWTLDYFGIYKITPAGSVTCYANAAGTAATMQADGLGNIYILTREPNNCLYKVSSAGTVARIAGMLASEVSSLVSQGLPIPVDGPALQSTFWGVSHFVVAPDGSALYASNGDEYCIRRIKAGYTMTLYPDGWHTDTTSRNKGWFLGGPMYIDPKGVIYLMGNNPPDQLGLRKIVPVQR